MIGTRLLYSGAFIGLAFILVLVSALRLAQPTVLSPNLSSSLMTPSAVPASDIQTAQQRSLHIINQYLPHPGILPDHPLYWLKMVRDKAQLVITREQHFRFELLLLYADKRLGAGEKLINKQQSHLGVATISKAEKYLLQAGELLAQKPDKSKQHIEQLALTLDRHQQLITVLVDLVSESDKQTLQEAIILNKTVYETQVKPFLAQSTDSSLQAP